MKNKPLNFSSLRDLWDLGGLRHPITEAKHQNIQIITFENLNSSVTYYSTNQCRLLWMEGGPTPHTQDFFYKLVCTDTDMGISVLTLSFEYIEDTCT